MPHQAAKSVISTHVRLVQPAKAASSISVTELPIVTFVKR